MRFDPVYFVYFKTNAKALREFPNLLGLVRDIYAIPEVRRSTNMGHIKTHYFTSHPHLNAFGIVPMGEGPDLEAPHGREHLP